MKKAQAATEYIIILAVVVIISLIVVGILGGFPAIGRGSSARTSAAYWASAPIGIVSYDIATTADPSSIVVMNNMASTITIQNIRMDESTTPPTTSIFSTDTTLNPGEEASLDITAVCATQGSTYSFYVEIEYDNEDTGETGLELLGASKLEGPCLS